MRTALSHAFLLALAACERSSDGTRIAAPDGRTANLTMRIDAVPVPR